MEAHTVGGVAGIKEEHKQLSSKPLELVGKNYFNFTFILSNSDIKEYLLT